MSQHFTTQVIAAFNWTRSELFDHFLVRFGIHQVLLVLLITTLSILGCLLHSDSRVGKEVLDGLTLRKLSIQILVEFFKGSVELSGVVV